MAILTEHPGWKVLCNHQETIQKLHMRNLFESDPQRFDKFSLKLDDLLLDYSKHRITEETLGLLMQLAREAKIESWRDRMFSGEKINITEDRAVLHTALRNRSNTPVYVDDQDVMPDVNAVLAQMRVFSDKVRSGEWKGYTGKKITDVVNIGIGGSDLGPVMVCDALKPYANPELNIHFVSNIDGAHLVRALEKCNPEEFEHITNTIKNHDKRTFSACMVLTERKRQCSNCKTFCCHIDQCKSRHGIWY